MRFRFLKAVVGVLLALVVLTVGSAFPSFAEIYKYEPATVSLQGKLLSATGETPDGKKIKYPALRLHSPIMVNGDQNTPTEKGVLLLHMALGDETMAEFKRLKGQSVTVTGTLFHSDNGNHQTNVLITPSKVTPSK
nr:DUF4431 domain-containing protein [uncultured Rhodoferax sp.]